MCVCVYVGGGYWLRQWKIYWGIMGQDPHLSEGQNPKTISNMDAPSLDDIIITSSTAKLSFLNNHTFSILQCVSDSIII